jgi:hypothetical protein
MSFVSVPFAGFLPPVCAWTAASILILRLPPPKVKRRGPEFRLSLQSALAFSARICYDNNKIDKDRL